MRNILFITLLHCIVSSTLYAQIPELNLQTAVKIDFQSFKATGFAPSTDQGRLDSRAWRVTGLSDGMMQFEGTYLGGDYGRGISPGKISSGGVYAFQVNAATRILGFQATGTDLIPGTLTLKINVKDLDKADRIEISYDAYVMNDQNRSTAVKFEWSADDNTYTKVDGLHFNTPIASESQASWQMTTLEGKILTPATISSDVIYLRWVMNDAGGSGSRDEWGISNIQIKLIPSEKNDDDQGERPSAPTSPATDITLENRTDTTITVRWKNGSGSSRLMLVKPNPAAHCKPQDLTSYSANSNFALADTTQGSCAVVYNGTGSRALLTGLTPDQDLHLAIIEYNGEKGEERYQTEVVTQSAFRTRSSSPPRQESLKIVFITDNELYLNWESSTRSEIRIVLADNMPIGDQLLAFENDAYQTIDSTGLNKVCSSSKPCLLQRSEIGDKTIYAWNVAGKSGHRSAQHQEPIHIVPEWPSDEFGALLAKWLFDDETDDKSQSIWDFDDASFSIQGARDRGYAPGNTGQARYTDQWDESNGSKSWKVTLSTWGFEEMSVSFKLISSNTGPADFQLMCSHSGNLSRDSRILKSGSSWNTSERYTVPIPKDCLGKENIDIHIAAIGNTALNGNPVSRSGTSRIDELTFWGKQSSNAGILLSHPKVVYVKDDSTTLATHLISTGGDYPVKRFVKLWNGNTEFEVALIANGSKIQNVRLSNLSKQTEYQVEHCVWTIQTKSCSPSTLFRTPYAIPLAPNSISVYATHLDSIAVEHDVTQSDLWAFLTDNQHIEPQFIDSIGLEKTLDESSSFTWRFSPSDRAVFGGLRPGRDYFVWLASVNGPDSVMRFSRPPYSNHKIRLPKLPSPDHQDLRLNVLQRGTDTIRFEILDSTYSKVLWTIGPEDVPESIPNDDVDYKADHRYGYGESLSPKVYVIQKGKQAEITLKNLPLSRAWVLRGYAYNELNGAISYHREALVAFPFKSLTDPREYLIKVPDITHKKDKESFGLQGSVAWRDSEKLILLGDGGNVILHHQESGIQPGDSIAAFVYVDNQKIRLRYFLHLGSRTRSTLEPFIVDPKKIDSEYRNHSYLGFGNVLPTNIGCAIHGHFFFQRGSVRRPICVLNLGISATSVADISETALRGIPIWTNSDTTHVWVIKSDDLIPYTPGKVFTSLPNTGQLLTWRKGSNDQITFSLVRRPAQRLYDTWPDSTNWKTYLGTRIAGAGNPFILRAEIQDSEISFPAGELHRLHLGSDSISSHVDIEWTVWNQEGRISEAREVDLLWQPFQLLRVDATQLQDSPDIPKTVELSQPWPNPFNPSTHFRLHLPSTDHVKVHVYDIIGRRVATIVDTILDAGIHEIAWNAKGVSSGMFLLKVQYQDKILVRSMTLLK
jgi:hypothetical protein